MRDGEGSRMLASVGGPAIYMVLAFRFRLIRGGLSRVDGFFVLSGFLIAPPALPHP